MINYAHRGASEYAPENTLSAFYLGLLQGANGIETDVQRTKDGQLVLSMTIRSIVRRTATAFFRSTRFRSSRRFVCAAETDFMTAS